MNEKIKFKLLTFIRYLGDSFFYPFLALYLNTKTIGVDKIGYLIAITPLISIIVNPIYASFCKNAKTVKITLSIIGIIEALMIVLLSLTSNYWLLLLITILLAISGTSHYGLMDSLMTMYSSTHNINFGNIRMYGSAAYIFGTLLGGIAINWLGYHVCFSFCGILFVISSILYLSLKPIFNEAIPEEKRNYKEVFNNKGLMLFIIFYILLVGIRKANDSYYSLLFEERGINSVGYGIIFSVIVIAEIITLIICDKFSKKFNFKILMLIAICGISLMLLINSTNLPNIVLIIFGMLRGVAWGIVLHSSYKIVVSLAGVKNATPSIMLQELGCSILVVLSNSLGGILIKNTSYSMYYLILGIIGTITIIYYILFVRKYVPKKEVENEIIHSN